MKFQRKWLVLAVLLAALTLFTSCGSSIFEELSKDSDSDVFCRTFIDHVIADEKEETYQMFNGMCSRADFEELWTSFRATADGADSADIHMTGFWFYTENGGDFFKGQYFVEYSNGSTMNLSLVFADGETIYQIIYLDVTDFYADAVKTSGILNIVLGVYSLLVLAFCVWMIVDCARRPMKKKPLWIILIIAGVSLTLRIGEHSTFSFMIGLFVQSSSASVDLDYLAIATRIIVPVGAIVYFLMRKRLTVLPTATDPDAPTDIPPSPAVPDIPAAPADAPAENSVDEDRYTEEDTNK